MIDQETAVMLWRTMTSRVTSGDAHLFDAMTALMRGVEYLTGDILAVAFRNSDADTEIATHLQEAIRNVEFSIAISHAIKRLRRLCSACDISERDLLGEAISTVVPGLLHYLGRERNIQEYHFSREDPDFSSVMILREIWKRTTVPRLAIRELATNLGLVVDFLPLNRIPPEEREFLTTVIREAITQLSEKQKIRVLTAFIVYGTSDLIKPATSVLEAIGSRGVVEALRQILTTKSQNAWICRHAHQALQRLIPGIL